MKNRFGKIGVLAGGPSNEREISLRSGHRYRFYSAPRKVRRGWYRAEDA
jgi:D-alanine-D-alanine ligase-like ATP-grasp enzyme